jgi:hypothetical protein
MLHKKMPLKEKKGTKASIEVPCDMTLDPKIYFSKQHTGFYNLTKFQTYTIILTSSKKAVTGVLGDNGLDTNNYLDFF